MNQPTHHKSKLLLFVHLVKQSIRGDEHDYTKGSIRQAIILLAIPMILELSLESVFALVDMFFVGRLGDVAVATVGLTESVIAIVYSVAIGLSTAAAAMVSRRTGEKNHDEAAHAGAQAIILSTLVTVLISTAGVIYAPEILRAMGAQQEVVTQGAIFTRILLGGSIVIVLIFLINGIFRGAGNAAMAMRSLWIASGINIILCPLLIYGIGPIPGLGLKGAAIATTIGRGIGVAYQCYYLARGKGNLTFRRRHFAYDWKMIAALVRVAWPATLQFLIGSGSWIVLARLVAESGGTAASAGYQAAIRNVVFFILP
ncbi:MAG TPA: MATE family efflux transporter, partial [Chitinophagaceae bacterium]